MAESASGTRGSGVTLGRVAEVLGATVAGDATVRVTGATHDSQRVVPGWLFCCVRGEHRDGHDFAADAVAAGAAALLVERPLEVPVAQIVVTEVRAAMGPAAEEIAGHPDRDLDVIGVTGTNGKTTTVSLIAHVLGAAGRPTEVIGTLTGTRTTPEATELAERLRRAADEGRRAVAMEVSSHALALRRVDGIHFAAVLFTNLGADHLDFHETPERYFEAKARLFDEGRADVAIIDVDTPHGRLLRDTTPLATVTTSLDTLVDLVSDERGSRFTWRGHLVELPLLGRHNVANALLAAEACRAVGVEEAAVAAALGTAPPVSGRFEIVPSNAPFRVVVDFAHTPDALTAALEAARQLASGSVTVVFGCGGDRDQLKRPRMGAVADALADSIVITSDNPRSEDPSTIMSAVRSGVERLVPRMIEDRRGAIETAIATAGRGDVVLIAGKGHETTQQVGADTVAFDDRVVVAELLRAAGYEVGS